MKFLKYVERNLPPAARTLEVRDAGTGEVKSAFEAVIEEAAKHAALAPVPSAATYYRWLKLRDKGADALVGNYSNCGNRRQVEPAMKRIVKDTFHIVLDEAVAVIKAGGQVRLRMKTLTNAVDAAIKQAQSLNPTVALTRPSRSTLYDWWSDMPAVKRDTLRLGVVKTRQAYRFTTGHEHPVNALDEAEFDECDTPIFVCDDSGVLLGRLTLCWTIDVACHAVTGLDLSFEPPGDTTMMSTFKNAIMSKSYLTQVFPELSGRWLQYGIPRLIRVDRSRQALGKTAEELSIRLDIDWDWCDAMTPYFKAYVEMMFRILNQMLLEELPGYVLPVHLRRPDYDPSKNGLIRMRDLLCIIHAFIVLYNEKPQDSLGGLSPNAMWLRSTARVAPELPDDAEDMARLFAILREGRMLGHNGVVIRAIPYGGDALQAIRLRLGQRTEVDVMMDAGNMANAWVRADRRSGWVRAESRRPEYTAGRSLHQHELIRKYEREHFGTDCERLPDAEAELRAVIASTIADPLSVRLNKLKARFEGLGMRSLLLEHEPVDRPGEPAGQAAGERSCPTPPQGPDGTSWAGALPSPPEASEGTTGDPDGVERSTVPIKRPRRAFAGDQSLAAE